MRSLRLLSLSRNSPHFIGTKGSLPHSQHPTNSPYLELDQSSPSPTLHSSSWRSILLLFPSTLRSNKQYLSLISPHQNLYAPLLSCIRDTCPAHLILLDFITRIIFGEERISWSYHYPVSSTPLWNQTPSSVIILSLFIWFNEKDEASHPYKT